MDSLITAAARALAAGDPLGALKRIALREDAAALALRGIAMAQLGDLTRARLLLRRAARTFGPTEAVARARCVVAEAEVAFASRELSWPARALDEARVTLAAHGDRANAAHARYLEVRRLLLIGRIEDARRTMAELDPAALPPAARAVHELMAGGIAMRRLQSTQARDALDRARIAAAQAGIPALTSEVDGALALLETPVARLIHRGHEHPLQLADVEALMASQAFIVDACRHIVRHGPTVIPLARRPVLFAIARTLAEAWPDDVARDDLVARAFGARYADESHRARLRVEMARLRVACRAIADVRATRRGFTLVPRVAPPAVAARAASRPNLATLDLVVVALPVDDAHASVRALLADGEAWSSSAVALALGASQRTVQRALDSLAAAGNAQSFGRGRARRWTSPPLPGFATTLLLPAIVPPD
jgi:hypothetical protein